MSGSSGPVGDVAGRVARNVTARIVSRVVGLAVAALLAAIGLKQCGKSPSREAIAERSTAIINVNTASVDQLMTLPRVNENLAHRIVAARPYATVDDLRRVSGIGPKTLEGMRPRVVMDAAAQPGK